MLPSSDRRFVPLCEHRTGTGSRRASLEIRQASPIGAEERRTRDDVSPATGRRAPRDEQGSSAQRDRRKRILDATLALASKGGYDAVQMRAVAERADVALGTLYRYFPSKIHLLVSALAREFERTQDRVDRAVLRGDTRVRTRVAS